VSWFTVSYQNAEQRVVTSFDLNVESAAYRAPLAVTIVCEHTQYCSFGPIRRWEGKMGLLLTTIDLSHDRTLPMSHRQFAITPHNDKVRKWGLIGARYL
jgi:hypothetical protein